MKRSFRKLSKFKESVEESEERIIIEKILRGVWREKEGSRLREW